MTRTLRPYQEQALAALLDELRRVASTLLVLPTGMGKTVIAARLASEWKRGNVLFLAHRVELLEQAADKLTPELGYRPVIEQAQRGMEDGCLWQGGMVMVGSVATMRSPKRLEKFREHPFDLIVIDEAHHATAQSYRRVVDFFLGLNPACKVVGITATPRRTDKTALGTIFTSCAYQYAIDRGITEGWLVPVRNKVITVENVDFSGLRSSVNEFGESDYNQQDLESVLIEEEPLHALAGPILKESGGRQGVVFTAGVAHAHLLADILTRGTKDHAGLPAAAVDGDTDPERRAQILRDFNDGKIRFLCNFNIFTEGWDCPPAALVAMGRMTKSVSVFTQMLGRVLRPLDGVVDGYADAADRRMAILTSDKPHALSLDFVGNSRHRFVTCEDALGGNYDLDTLRAARERPPSPGGDVLDNLRKARAEILLEREREARRHIRASVAYAASEDDLFEGGPAPAAHAVENTRGGSSDAQIAFLVNLGVARPTAAGYTRRQASAVIEKLKATRCTSKQRAILERYGEPTDVNFEQASAIIDQIASRGWMPRG
jgi:superfamily II DNA or RNA helicase